MTGNNRIVFVANTSWSIYKFRLYIIHELLQSGYEIYVLAPRDRYTHHFESLAQVHFVELKHFQNNKVSPRDGLRLYRELKQAYQRIDPALIFHYTIKANIFGSLAAGKRYPSVGVITGLGYAFMEDTAIQKIARILYRFSLKKAREVWFLNHDNQQLFIRNKLVAATQTFVLPGEGIDTDYYYPAPYEASNKAVTYLMIGRLIKYKGIYELVDAIKILKQKGLAIECRLLGKYDPHLPGAVSKAELEAWEAQQLITWLGETDNVRAHIEPADCILLPSYSEGLPLSLLEGASMCKALIATDTPGCRELVTDQVNGFLCTPRSAESLASKMEAYFHLTPQQKKNMGNMAREKIKNRYDKQLIADIYKRKIEGIEATRQQGNEEKGKKA
jgi:glycosyltransferase involved in cell wall biosynthesis